MLLPMAEIYLTPCIIFFINGVSENSKTEAKPHNTTNTMKNSYTL